MTEEQEQRVPGAGKAGGRLRVGVLFGGRSAEHEVSLMSARSVIAAMDPEKYEAVPIAITIDGQWVRLGSPEDLPRGTLTMAEARQLAAAGAPGLQALLPGTPGSGSEVPPQAGRPITPATELPRREHDAAASSETGGRGPLDIVFPVLHGPYGEDGTVQGFLELAGVPYVGSGVTSSAVGMDKEVMKSLFLNAGLPTPDFEVYKTKVWRSRPETLIAAIEEHFAYPVFVKPVNLGSSVGVGKAKDRESLRECLDEAAQFARRILVEAAVPEAREIECSVLGNDEPEASVLGEIVPANEFYDYGAKYENPDSRLIIPADLADAAAERIRSTAIEAFKLLNCAGMARVDFLVTADAREIYLNELNTLPGFTEVSMYPKLWEASGLSYPELIDRLIELAMERHRERQQLRVRYRD